MSTSTTLQGLLLVIIAAMAGLAVYFLSQRRLTWPEYCRWGLLALALPLLGPFLVILYHPGTWRAPARGPSTPPVMDRLRQFVLMKPSLRRRRMERR